MGLVGETISPTGICTMETPPLPNGRGRCQKHLRTFRILMGGFVVFICFLVSEKQVPKQLKQFSIVGIKELCEKKKIKKNFVFEARQTHVFTLESRLDFHKL